MTDKRDHEISMARRSFLYRSIALAVAPWVLSAVPARAIAKSAGAAGGPSGKATISVRDKGARGDGKTDDTVAFQAAIDALPDSGGTVTVPAGNYMIDPVRSVNLRSNMRLQMEPRAQLTAIPNGLTHYSVVKVFRVQHVEISGGRIVGERDGHSGSGGEWGFGLNIRASSDVRVTDLHVSDCWGDGIWIGALGKGPGAAVSTDVTLDRVVSTNNRRQGLSIGPVRTVNILNSTFSGTHGTAPEAGIDIEPQGQGPAQDITVAGCTISGNHGTGMEMHAHVSGVVVKQCTIEGNAGYGLLAVHTDGVTVTDNSIIDNGLFGVVIAKKTNNVTVTGNTLSGNSARYVRKVLRALKHADRGKHADDLRVDDTTTNVQVSDNKFSS